MTPRIGNIFKGAVAGLAGTLAMDLLWYRRYRSSGGEDGFREWEFAAGIGSFDEASAPAQLGRKAAGVVGVDLPESTAGTTTNVVHWTTGLGYGAGHGIAHAGRHPLLAGLATGLAAFTNSYTTMGVLGLYEPIWKYDAATLAKDLSAHLTFGAVTGLVYGALTRNAD